MSLLKSPFEFNTILELTTYFKEEEKCIEYIKEWRWQGTVRCIQCGFAHVYHFKDGKRFKCGNCKEHFTVTCGTIMQSTKLPLSKWILAIFLIGGHKKGISSCQLGRDLGVTQTTAWHMLHKIREMLVQDDRQLEGVVSSDETFVGGKNKNRHRDKKLKYGKDRDWADKTPVIGMMQADGFVKTKVLKDATNESIRPVVLQSVKRGSTLVTDEYKSYRIMHKFYNHEKLNHQKGFLSPNGFSTNNIEGFWSQLKRMIIGIYHKVSRKYLQNYMNELTFRHNTRKEKQGVRFAMMMSMINQKITYKQLTHG